jgi:hypothetical protein
MAAMSQKFSPHENYADDEPIEAGSDRAFGCTVGGILIVIGATKMVIAGAVLPVAALIFVLGVILLLLGIVSPKRLSILNRLWMKIGAAMAKVVNPIVLGLLFFLVVSPMAIVMRLLGKRPLRLAPDPTKSSYWIERERPPSSMKQQF